MFIQYLFNYIWWKVIKTVALKVDFISLRSLTVAQPSGAVLNPRSQRDFTLKNQPFFSSDESKIHLFIGRPSRDLHAQTHTPTIHT